MPGCVFRTSSSLNARLRVPNLFIPNTLLLGADWNMDKNYGAGQVFDPTLPLYPGISSRQRKLSEIPANHTVAAYAEENITLPVASGKIELMAGLRAAQMLNLPASHVMHAKTYLDPRANIGWTLPRFDVGHWPVTVRLSGGWGEHTKNPTMEQLFPELVYIDLVQLNYYHENPDFRRITASDKRTAPARRGGPLVCAWRGPGRLAAALLGGIHRRCVAQAVLWQHEVFGCFYSFSRVARGPYPRGN